MSGSPAGFEALFSRFVEALAREDVEAFRALCVPGDPSLEERFTGNASRLNARGLAPRLARVEREREVATVHFRLVHADGTAAGDGQLVLALTAEGWRIRRL